MTETAGPFGAHNPRPLRDCSNAIPLSVVMPVYNEEDSIALAVEDVQRHVLAHVPGAELVAVDDGSRDRTGELLNRIAAADPRVRVIHQANRGHGGALITGIAAASGTYIFLIDSDRQIPLEAFPSAWTQIEAGHDAVFGVRRRRHDPAIRLRLSRLIRGVVHALFGVRMHDTNVPYKLVKRSIWTDAQPYIPAGTLAPSLFLAIFAARRGYDIAEIDVEHRARATGTTTIRRLRLLRFCAKALRQLIAFRRQLSHVE